MKKIIVIPDSFKGTMSSKRVCEICKKTIGELLPEAEILAFPIADGGEGSLDVFISALGGRKIEADVSGPYFERIKAHYAVLADGKTAVIESTCCAGLTLVEGRENPALTTTYGVGELMFKAIKNGCNEIILCLGGSATNDAGCGAASALGTKFNDEENKSFVPTGISLDKVHHIDNNETSTLLYKVKVTAMCDVENPMYGKNGAAYVFAPQKGADLGQVIKLDSNLRHICGVIKNSLKISVENLKGAGAAGGFGGGAAAFFNADLKSGIEILLDLIDFDSILDGVDLVITGEGKADFQSAEGKVISGIARRTKKKNVPLTVIAGTTGEGYEKLYDLGVDKIITVNTPDIPFETVKKTAEKDLYFTVKNYIMGEIL